MPREAPDSTYPAGAADSPVGPDELEGAEFGRARKGFAPDEVTELLRRAAGALRLAMERADHLEEELAVARRDSERLLAEAADEATEMVAIPLLTFAMYMSHYAPFFVRVSGSTSLLTRSANR